MKHLILAGILVLLLAAGCSNKSKIRSQAQEFYQQGIELLGTGAVNDLLNAIDLFRKSVQIDSTFAAGYAQIAITNAYLAGNYNFLSPEKAYSEAIPAADKAVTLDADLAEGYVAKALIDQYHNWRWLEADRNLKRALEIEPDNVEILLENGWSEIILNKPEEAGKMYEKAKQLSPDSPRVRSFLVFEMIYSGRFDEARKHILDVINTNPQDAYGYWDMAVLCSKEGSHEEAIKNLNIQIPLMKGDIADELALLGYNYGRIGKTDDALAQLTRLDEAAANGIYVSPVDKAWIYCGVNDKENALVNLEKGFEQRANRMGFDLRFYSFIYQPIADDPRFIELLNKSNLQ